MVRVPVYERQAELGGLPGARVSPSGAGSGQEALGQGIAAASRPLQQAAAELEDIGLAWRHEADVARVQAATAELSRTRLELLEGPEGGLFQAKGANAVTEYGSVRNTYEAKVKQLSGNLSHRQQAAFQAEVTRDQEAFLSAASAHVAKEGAAYAQSAHDAVIPAATNDGIAAALRSDQKGLTNAVSSGLRALDVRAAAAGWGKEELEVRGRAFRSELYLGTVEALMAQGRNTEAAELLASVRDRVDEGEVRERKLDAVLAARTAVERSAGLADQAWEKAAGDPDRAAAWLREQEAPTEVRDDALQRISQRGNAVAAARRQADSPRLGRLEQEMLTTGRLSRHTDDWTLLSDEGKADALRMLKAEQRSRRSAHNEERRIQAEIDRNAEANFRSRDPYGQAGEDQVSVDITASYPDASQRQRDLLREKQNSVKRGAERGLALPRSEFNRRIAREARDLGLDSEQAARFGGYLQDLYEDWLEDPKHQGRKPTGPDVDEMFGNALQPGEEDPDSTLVYETDYLRWDAVSQGIPWVPDEDAAAAAALEREEAAAAAEAAGGAAAPPEEGAAEPADTRPRRVDPTTGVPYRWTGSAWVEE